MILAFLMEWRRIAPIMVSMSTWYMMVVIVVMAYHGAMIAYLIVVSGATIISEVNVISPTALAIRPMSDVVIQRTMFLRNVVMVSTVIFHGAVMRLYNNPA